MWGRLSSNRAAKDLSNGGVTKVHVDDPQAETVLSEGLGDLLALLQADKDPRQIVVLCIGTDRSTGDALGPLTGSFLQELAPDIVASPGFAVYGTLNSPVHATNLSEALDMIATVHGRPLIIAVDACLGKSESVGHVTVGLGPVRPGTGVNKVLPMVGDVHITGVVNVGGYMEYLVLQNTRLNLVMRMSRLIASAMALCIRSLQAEREVAMAQVPKVFPDLPFPAEPAGETGV